MARRIRTLLSLSSLIVAASIAACASDKSEQANPDPTIDAQTENQAQGTPTPEAAQTPTAPPGTATIPDARLANEVLMKLVADREVDARNFAVHVVAGKVTLAPEPNTSDQEKSRARSLANAIEGVLSVEVEGFAPTPEPLDDDAAEVVDAVEEVLEDSPLQDSPAVEAAADEPTPSVAEAIDAPAEVASPAPPVAEDAPAEAKQDAPTQEQKDEGDLRPYTVRRGESLSIIAARQLGDGSRWNEVYRMNRDIIGPNPDGLREGMTIMLPPRR